MGILNTSIPLQTRLINRKTDRAYRNDLSTPWEGFNGEGRYRKRVYGFDTLDNARGYWRNVEYCDEVKDASIRHKGWVANEFCDETIRGVVAQLPSRNGAEVWLAGYEESGGMVVFYLDLHDSADEASRRADEHARVTAESEREYQAEESRKMRAEYLRELIKSARDEVKSLRAAIRRAKSDISEHKAELQTLEV